MNIEPIISSHQHETVKLMNFSEFQRRMRIQFEKKNHFFFIETRSEKLKKKSRIEIS